MTTIETIALSGAVLAVLASLVVAAIARAEARSLRERISGMGHMDALVRLDEQLLAKRAQVAEQEDRLLRERERLLGQEGASVSANAAAHGDLRWELGRLADLTSASFGRLQEGAQGSLTLLQRLTEMQTGTARETQTLLQQLPVLINALASEQKRLSDIVSSREPPPQSFAPHALRAGPLSVSAFSPSTVRRAEAFVLDIWAYPSHSFRQVQERAASLERSRHVGVKNGLRPRLESFISIKVCLPSLIVREPIDGFYWVAEPANASYEVFVPEDASLGTHSGRAELFCDGLKIGKLHLAVHVSDKSCVDARIADTTVEARTIRTAFASYAAADRQQVFARLQGIKKVLPNVDIFVDVLALRSGDDWRTKLEEHVPNKDVFFLFWSRAAARSRWVTEEWQLALSRRGLDYIDPVPIESADAAPPPSELSTLHFNDAYALYLTLAKSQGLESSGEEPLGPV